jgi:CHAD domain-containing protein
MKASKPNLPEIYEDHGYCLLGADTLLRQIATLENQMEGVRKNYDIEFMHKLRVTSRRMRAALSLFEECFPKKASRKWMKGIRNVTDLREQRETQTFN